MLLSHDFVMHDDIVIRKQQSRFVTVNIDFLCFKFYKRPAVVFKVHLGCLTFADDLAYGTVSFAGVWSQWMCGSPNHIVGIISLAAS